MRALLGCALPLLSLSAARCGASDRQANDGNGGSAVENRTLTKLELTTDAFDNGGPIPIRYTCDGVDQRPVLHWSDPPLGTKSFALVVVDPDAPSGTFRHWGVYDIPPTDRSAGAQRLGKEVTNDFGKLGYKGPCPPKGHGPHHYHFKLFALDTDRLNLPPNAEVVDVENAATRHSIAQGELVGTYERR